jgi:hypothetical protein
VSDSVSAGLIGMEGMAYLRVGVIVYGVDSLTILFSRCLLLMLVTEEVSSAWLVAPVQRYWSRGSEILS